MSRLIKMRLKHSLILKVSLLNKIYIVNEKDVIKF